MEVKHALGVVIAVTPSTTISPTIFPPPGAESSCAGKIIYDVWCVLRSHASHRTKLAHSETRVFVAGIPSTLGGTMSSGIRLGRS